MRLETLNREIQRAQKQLLGDSPFFPGLKDDDQVGPESQSPSGDVKLSYGLSESSESAKWDLPPSIHADFARHDPSMFPEASSTVPDNTADQLRMIEAALNDRTGKPTTTIPIKDSSSCSGSSSIPWSAYLATQNKSQTSRHPRQATAEPRESFVEPTASEVADPTIGMDMEPSYTPTGSPACGSVLARLDPLTAGAQQERIHAEDPPAEPIPSSKSKKKRRHDDDAESEQVFVDGQPQEAASSSKSKKKQKRQNNDLARSDEIAIGLPKEQYKPRPSRSRSAQMTSEPIDYSVASERAAKRKLKRARTTESLVQSTQSPSSKKVKAMGEMGFTPNRSKEALTASGGNLEEAIEGLLNGSIAEKASDDQASQSRVHTAYIETTNAKSPTDAPVHAEEGLPNEDQQEAQLRQRREMIAVEIPHMTPPVLLQCEANETTSETYVTAHECIVPRDKSAELAEQTTVSSSKSSQKNSKKRKRSSRGDEQPVRSTGGAPSDVTTSNELLPGKTIEDRADEFPPEPPEEKKRERGRPRKVSRVITDEEELEDIALKSPSRVKSEELEVTEEPLQEVDANSKMSKESESGEIKKEEPEPVALTTESEHSPRTPAPQSENAVEAKTSTSVSARPLSQSPATKGKVPHRVGLSRRARIAPLLKIVKK